MKKFFLMLMLALGAMLSFASCATLGFYRPDGSVIQYAQDDIIYRSGDITYNGTRIVGDHGCPIGLYWANAAITRWGMIVKVKDKDGAVIKQYDLRVPRQKVDDVFYVTGLTGKPLEVNVIIRGGSGSINYVTVHGGDSNERYSLRR